MGYGNLDLDEIKSSDLAKELTRRGKCAGKLLCPYCGQPLETHTCKFKGAVQGQYGLKYLDLDLKFPEPKPKTYCSCELRDRQWNPNTKKCETCGGTFIWEKKS